MLNNYLENTIKNFFTELYEINNINSLNNINFKYNGRNGLLNKMIKKIKDLPTSEKKYIGEKINKFKNQIIDEINNKKKELCEHKKNDNNYIDISLPSIGKKNGNIHIINSTLSHIEKYFNSIGFKIVNGNEIENEYNNFEALNIPKTHPARKMHDTFYLKNDLLLRTHTSNMQIKIMKKKTPPLKIISSGKVYRKDSDSTHTPMFHQIEGFIVDIGISISNLKYIIINFLDFFFEKNLKYNFRPSYFPFTEPSIEVDIACFNCDNNGCNLCKFTGWIEVLGCGLIHPNVLKNCEINNKKYTGLAFGLGLERLIMIKFKISDIRMYFENNLDFLKQFK